MLSGMYAMQVLLSDSIEDDVKEARIRQFYDSRHCCCGVSHVLFRRWLRSKFSTREAGIMWLKGPEGRRAMQTFQEAVSFSNVHVECENNAIKDICASETCGALPPRVLTTAVCRHVRLRHQEQTGSNPAKVERPQVLQARLHQGYALPPSKRTPALRSGGAGTAIQDAAAAAPAPVEGNSDDGPEAMLARAEASGIVVHGGNPFSRSFTS